MWETIFTIWSLGLPIGALLNMMVIYRWYTTGQDGPEDGDVSFSIIAGAMTSPLWPITAAYQVGKHALPVAMLVLPSRRQERRALKAERMHQRNALLLKEALDSHRLAMDERKKRHRLAIEQFDRQSEAIGPDLSEVRMWERKLKAIDERLYEREKYDGIVGSYVAESLMRDRRKILDQLHPARQKMKELER